MMKDSIDNKYVVHLNGTYYELPIVPINDEISIVVYDMLNNPRLVYDSAVELDRAIHYSVGWDNIDVIVTPECKCIPLAYELATIESKDLVVLRKSEKLYNPTCITQEVKSITTDKVQRLYLSSDCYDKLYNRKVLIVDDVISTGESCKAVESLIKKVQLAEVVGRAFVFAEGNQNYDYPVIYIDQLPIISKEVRTTH